MLRKASAKERRESIISGLRTSASDEAIAEARAKDAAELETAKADFDSLAESAEALRVGQQTVGLVLDFRKTKVQPLFQKAAQTGEPGVPLVRALEKIEDTVLDGITNAVGGERRQEVKDLTEQERALRIFEHNVFLAQAFRKDSPIREDEFASALLCETVATLRDVLDVPPHFSSLEEMNALFNDSPTLVKNAAQQGLALNGAEEKLDLIEEYARTARKGPTA